VTEAEAIIAVLEAAKAVDSVWGDEVSAEQVELRNALTDLDTLYTQDKRDTQRSWDRLWEERCALLALIQKLTEENREMRALLHWIRYKNRDKNIHSAMDEVLARIDKDEL